MNILGLDVTWAAIISLFAAAISVCSLIMTRKSQRASAKISSLSVRQMIDTRIIDWSSDVIMVMSEVTGLGYRFTSQISEREFEAERRQLMSRLIALRDKGRLLFEVRSHANHDENLKKIDKVYELLKQLKHGERESNTLVCRGVIDMRNAYVESMVHVVQASTNNVFRDTISA